MHIDVLIISYNRPELLEHTLKSLAAQTYRDFTVHVVDNGSQPAVDPGIAPVNLDIRWKRNENNEHQCDISNEFLANLRTDIFCGTADDDAWAPHTLEIVATLFTQNSDMDVLGLGFTHYDHVTRQPCVGDDYLRSFTGKLQRFDAAEVGFADCNSWGIGPKKDYKLPRIVHGSVNFLRWELVKRIIARQRELFIKPFGDVGYVGCCFNTKYVHYLDLPLGVIGRAAVREMEGSQSGGRHKWKREIPFLEHSPLRACSFVNMGADNHLKVLFRNGVCTDWDCSLQLEFFLRHIDQVASDDPVTEETARDLQEVLPYAIDALMSQRGIEGDEARLQARDELLGFIRERLEVHASAHERKEAKVETSAVPVGDMATEFPDIASFAAWQDKAVVLPLLGIADEGDEPRDSALGVEMPAMVVGVWNCYEELNKDGFLFKHAQTSIGDNLLKPLNDFYQIARKQGISLLTLDQITDFDHVDAFLFLDFPNLNHPLVRRAFESGGARYLITSEPEVVKPENWLREVHQLFDRVFTWNDDLVDGDKYLKVNYAQDFENRPADLEKDKFCTLIAGAKGSSHRFELYSERVRAIQWFEANHPEAFDLYGVGWNPDVFPSYRGRVENKLAVLQRYKFSICYENAANFPGYITEKIFDCFKARCVPVYLGAPNVDEYIPPNCYIDRNRFATYEELYSFLSSMSEAVYQEYLDNIELFLKTVQPHQYPRSGHQTYYPFTAEHFSYTVIGQLSRDHKQKHGVTPLVSVVIPAYNYGKFVATAIASVVTQDFQDIEVVVLDNASTDDTEQQIARFSGDKRVRYIRHLNNIGPTNNWWCGIQLATGKYLVLLSADDFLLPGHLRRLVSGLEQHPDCVLAYSPCVWVDDNDNALQILNHPGHPSENHFGGRDEVSELLIHDCYITPSAAIIRRTALDAVGGGFDSHMRGGDWDLWVRLAMRFGDFAFFKEPSACYRVHGNQDSQAFYASTHPLTDHMRILEKVLASDYAAKLVPHMPQIRAHLDRRFGAYPPEMTRELQARKDAIDLALTEVEQGKRPENREQPLVSVIIPTQNRPDMLIRAVRSVKAQTYPHVEIVVVNDGGVDVASVLGWLGRDARIQYINLPEKRGVCAARNMAIRACHGDIVTYLDDDDIFLPQHVQTVVDALKKNDARFVYTRSMHVIETLDKGQYKELGRGAAYGDMKYSKERLFIGNYIPINTWAHWKSCFDQIGYFDESMDNHEDWDFLLRCALVFDLVHIPEETVEVHNRQEHDNAMRRTRHKFLHTIEMLYARYGDLGNELVARGRQQMLRQLLVQGESGPAITIQTEGLDAPERMQQDYRTWRSKRSLQEIDAQIFAERMTLRWRQRPVFHLVMNLCRGQGELLADTLDSLGAQFYPEWKLTVLAPDPAPDPAFHEVANLRWIEASGADGATEALNALIAGNGDDWLLFLPPGALLEPHSLICFGDYVDLHPEWKLIYCDDDLIGPSGEVHEPRFKPDFNLDFLRSTDYIGPCMLRADALGEAGGCSTLPGAEGYDVSLRMLDQHGESAIGHIADVLVHLPAGWQTALDEANGRQAVAEHLVRRGIRGQVVEGYVPGTYRVVYERAIDPLVSIVIPNRDKLEFLQPCVESLLEKTAYPRYELLIVDNQSADPDVLEYYTELMRRHPGTVRVLSYDAPFNFSAMNNLAAREAKGEYLLLLNNDTQIIQTEWLERMLSYGQREEVGVVGARLVFPETGKIQHAGVLLGVSGIADHPFYDALSISNPGYMNRAHVDQNYSAVTAACLLVRKSVYEDVGGMDEDRFKVFYNDIDLCLKIGAAGKRIVWTPYATVVHHGSTSLKGDSVDLMKLALGMERTQQERAAMLTRWLPTLANDPAYNRHLSLAQPYTVEETVVIDWDTNFHDRPRVLGTPLSGGAGEYRMISPFRALSRAGLAQCDVVQPGQMFKTRVMTSVEIARAKPDTLVLHAAIDDKQREALGLYKQFNPEVLRVFTLDDLVGQIPKQNSFYRFAFKDAKPRLRTALALCDRVLVTTEPLADLCRPMIDDVRLVPNRLERAVWGDVRSLRRQGNKPRVGWAGAQQHAGDLALIADVVKVTAQEVDWVFLGMCPEELRPYVREFHDFVLSFYDYPAKLASLNLDLAVAPLEIHPFNEAKSNLRLLEYGIMGWPVVCTDIYPYQNAPVKRVANEPQAWIEAIRERVNDLDAAEREGDQLKAWVLQNFMLEDHLDEWMAALIR